MATHVLTAGPGTVHIGFYEAGLPPVLTVASGDLIEVHTEPAAPPEVRPMIGKRASAAFRRIVESCPRGPSSHLLNGPVAVAGAKAGDVLEVRFHRVGLRYDWGYNTILPLKGALPEEFPGVRCVVVELDRESGTGDWGAGVKVPLAPFFGNFGVAPPPALGRVPSAIPGAWGGNLDNRELGEGARVYLPVFNDGALFSIGDGHGCQGDGEVDSFALEAGLSAVIGLTVRRDLRLSVPRAETATHHILMGFDPILDNAAKMALKEAMDFLVERKGLGREDAYALCSMAVDLRVTQVVNGVKGVHAMLARSLVE